VTKYEAGEWNELTKGNKLSKTLLIISLIFLILTVLTLFVSISTIDPESGAQVGSERPWKIAGLFFLASVVTG